MTKPQWVLGTSWVTHGLNGNRIWLIRVKLVDRGVENGKSPWRSLFLKARLERFPNLNLAHHLGNAVWNQVLFHYNSSWHGYNNKNGLKLLLSESMASFLPPPRLSTKGCHALIHPVTPPACNLKLLVLRLQRWLEAGADSRVGDGISPVVRNPRVVLQQPLVNWQISHSLEIGSQSRFRGVLYLDLSTIPVNSQLSRSRGLTNAKLRFSPSATDWTLFPSWHFMR